MWLKVQVAIVAAGAVITGILAAAALYRYLVIGGDLAQFNGGPLANPLSTPCFYAAIGFAIATRLAVRQLKGPRARVELALGALSLAGVVLGLA